MKQIEGKARVSYREPAGETQELWDVTGPGLHNAIFQDDIDKVVGVATEFAKAKWTQGTVIDRTGKVIDGWDASKGEVANAG